MAILNRDVNSAQSAHFRTGRLRNNPNKRPKKGDDKSAAATVTDVRQLGCVSQDFEPPDSAAILRKGTKVLGPFRRVRFIQATQRHANIRDNKGTSLGKIQVKSSHQNSPYAMKIEDRSLEETDRQERCARGGEWPRISISSKKRTKLPSSQLPTSGVCWPHPP